MAIEGSVADITPVVSPDRAEHDILGSILDDFWSNQSRFCGRGATV